MILDQILVNAALALASTRWAGRDGGAAAVYTASGRILTSVFAESPTQSASLCHETGAICEAHKLNEPVAASVCVDREDAASPFVFLPPCGICCERLAFWGPEVEVAVPVPGDPTKWQTRKLRDIVPHYWGNQWVTGWKLQRNTRNVPSP